MPKLETCYRKNFTLCQSYGYTLIELIVSVVIIGVLIGTAVISLNNANEKQILTQSAKNTISIIKDAQSAATSGQRDASCPTSTSLSGWQVTVGSNSLQISPLYSSSCTTSLNRTYSLPAGVTASGNPGTFVFLPLGKGVVNNTTDKTPIDATICISASYVSGPYRIFISRHGEIQDDPTGTGC